MSFARDNPGPRKKPKQTGKIKGVYVLIPRDLHKTATRHAGEQDLTISKVYELALERFLERAS